jgi:histidine triad (HIT) family protein
MRSHAPASYQCPFCRIASGAEADAVVFNDGHTIGVVTLHQKARNQGAVLVLPTEHCENLYSLPGSSASRLFAAAQSLALVLKEVLGCEGVTLIQNNEPAGGQDVWHFHLHVVSRFVDDRFHDSRATVMPLEARAALARRIRDGFARP